MQARVAAAELKELPQRHAWLVGCFEKLRRFSDISAISRLGSRR